MDIKMLATDLDGTLLDDWKRITEKNRQALQEASASGMQVVLCTGRPFHTVRPYLPGLNIPCWLITNNGAVIRNPQLEVVRERTITPQVLKTVLKVLRKKPAVYFHGSDSTRTYVESRLTRMWYVYRFERKGKKPVVDALASAVKHSWFSGSLHRVSFDELASTESVQLTNLILISSNTRRLEQKRTELERIDGIFVTRSGNDNLEMVEGSTHKGSALQWLTAHLGMGMENVAAIGDHDNDITMIQGAGMGFATENAEPDLKKQARYVTRSNNEDALWHMLQMVKSSQKKPNPERGSKHQNHQHGGSPDHYDGSPGNGLVFYSVMSPQQHADGKNLKDPLIRQ